MSFIKVQGKDHLVRDSKSGAIINTNETARQNYLNRQKQLQKEQLEKQQLYDEVDRLRDKVAKMDGKIDAILALLKNTAV